MIFFCIGLWGITSNLLYEDYIIEIFLGMIAPLLIGVFSIMTTTAKFKKEPENLTKAMTKNFFIKIIVYGLYVTVILGFYTFNEIPFIVSFVGFFIILYGLEAYYLKKLFKKNY
jgi:hypothetical protein